VTRFNTPLTQLQHTCNILQHTCNIDVAAGSKVCAGIVARHTSTTSNTLQHTYNTLQHTATHIQVQRQQRAATCVQALWRGTRERLLRLQIETRALTAADNDDAADEHEYEHLATLQVSFVGIQGSFADISGSFAGI